MSAEFEQRNAPGGISIDLHSQCMYFPRDRYAPVNCELGIAAGIDVINLP